MRRIIFLLILLMPAVVFAGQFYVAPSMQSQVRKNSLNEREYPFDVALQAGAFDLPKEGTFDVSLRNYHVFNINENDFDLYQAVYRANNIGDVLDISAGRQFLSPGFSTYLMDGITTEIGANDWPVHFGLIAGVPRYVEISDFRGNVGLLGGGTVTLNGIENTGAKLTVLYDSVKVNERNWKRNDTVLTGLALYKKFDTKLLPELYSDFEYDTAAKLVKTGTAGFGFRPHWRLYLNAEGGYYNTNRDWSRPTVFQIFGTSSLYQADGGLNLILIDGGKTIEGLYIDASYSYQRYKTGPSRSDSGHIAYAGFGTSIPPLRLDADFGYRYYDSYGGRANDFQVALHDEPIKKLYLDASANFTKYEKITNENDTAISAFWMVGYQLFKDFVFSAVGEYFRNNTFKNELRATAMLTYGYKGKL